MHSPILWHLIINEYNTCMRDLDLLDINSLLTNIFSCTWLGWDLEVAIRLLFIDLTIEFSDFS